MLYKIGINICTEQMHFIFVLGNMYVTFKKIKNQHIFFLFLLYQVTFKQSSFVPIQSQDLEFQRYMLWSFLCSVSPVKMRGDCSFG